MNFIPAQIIKKKRDGSPLTSDEIRFMVSGYHQSQLPDYQMAALLMAIVLKGMTKQEAADLTLAMLHSGQQLEFAKSNFLPVDKHSTGGIGDKTSMLIAPIVAACGVPVPMIAGRGLGHTGGTLDKLESIPGFSVSLTLEQFQKQVLTLGCSIIGQTAEICPADKKMYALRDVTGTVESIPLICGSILSKKIAEGIKGLVMDVKWGTGAFMKTARDAEELALWLAETAAKSGLRTTAYITDMNQPLGRFIGNAIEIVECLSLLKNEPVTIEQRSYAPADFSDTLELSLELSAEMLVLSGHSTSFDDALSAVKQAHSSGAAFKKFEEMVIAQGGNLKQFLLPTDLRWKTVSALQAGFINSINGESVGYAAITLGAGRKAAHDVIDPAASIVIHKKWGEMVQTGDPLYSYACKNLNVYDEAASILAESVVISSEKPRVSPLIFKKISASKV